MAKTGQKRASDTRRVAYSTIYQAVGKVLGIGFGVVGSNPLQNVLDVKGSEQQMARTHPAAFQQPAWCRLAGPFSPSMSRVPLGLPQRSA